MSKIIITKESYEYLFNCSFYDQDRWWQEGISNHYIGVIYFTVGVLFEMFYIPSMLAMLTEDMRKLSCYKIMLLITMTDMIVLTINAIFSGYQAFVGAVTCNYPLANYICGVIALTGWLITGVACLLLSINRIIDMLSPTLSDILFAGRKTYVWLLVPIIYGFLGGVLTNPPGFTSKQLAWYYDPHFGTKLPTTYIKPDYVNFLQVIHNLLVTSIIAIVYGTFCVIVSIKFKTTEKITLSDPRGSLFLQSFIICFVIFFTGVINAYMQYLPTPDFVVVIGHFLWILSHGITSVILLILNKSIMKVIKKNFIPCLVKYEQGKTTMTKPILSSVKRI
uniref:Serpentine Receptor, class T n=1 Tax=Parastrongyloides trichosuri TaxID=131310 RepID=A0A0N4ZD41_PARTI